MSEKNMFVEFYTRNRTIHFKYSISFVENIRKISKQIRKKFKEFDKILGIVCKNEKTF